MTIEKAMEILKTVDGIECRFPGYTTALGIAVQALEKQIPKKIVWDSFNNVSNGEIHAFYWACCPNCGVNVWEEKNEKFKFCSDCGQALDWSEKE